MQASMCFMTFTMSRDVYTCLQLISSLLKNYLYLKISGLSPIYTSFLMKFHTKTCYVCLFNRAKANVAEIDMTVVPAL